MKIYMLLKEDSTQTRDDLAKKSVKYNEHCKERLISCPPKAKFKGLDLLKKDIGKCFNKLRVGTKRMPNAGNYCGIFGKHIDLYLRWCYNQSDRGIVNQTVAIN